MATFKICVFKHQKRKDGKYHVSIRVGWKRQYSYIETEYYVTEKQIMKSTFTLKDIYIINELNKRIELYEDLKLKKLGFKIHQYNAKELSAYFEKETNKSEDAKIDFIDFSRKYIKSQVKKKRISKSTAGNYTRTVNAIVDYCNGRENVFISEIKAKFLEGFEDYLKSERTITRINQTGKPVTVTKAPLSDVSVFDYMTDMRVLFNAAIDEFNDEDKNEIRIIHYPFRKYKLKPRPENKKRNLCAEQLHTLFYVSDEKLEHKRAILARDVFMLSFLLAGINLADLYEARTLKNGRLEYERMKTKSRRSDRAFISIKVEPEAMDIVNKYRDKTGKRVFDFYKRYTTPHIFSSNVNKGLKVVASAAGISEPLSTYYARHSWATIARNKCNVSKDDVDLALNHVDQGLKVADMYIEKDWSLIDRANRSVLNYVLQQLR